jgi:hypothetical protein
MTTQMPQQLLNHELLRMLAALRSLRIVARSSFSRRKTRVKLGRSTVSKGYVCIGVSLNWRSVAPLKRYDHAQDAEALKRKINALWTEMTPEEKEPYSIMYA